MTPQPVDLDRIEALLAAAPGPEWRVQGGGGIRMLHDLVRVTGGKP